MSEFHSKNFQPETPGKGKDLVNAGHVINVEEHRESDKCSAKNVYSKEPVILGELKDFNEKVIKLSRNQIVKLACDTLVQSECDEWFNSRYLRVSASKKAYCIKSRVKKTVETLIGDMLFPKKLDIRATRYGSEHESKAREKEESKRPNPTSYNEIRPISVVPLMSKILEKAMEIQLTSFFTKTRIIPKNQSGLKIKQSCCSALLNISDDILEVNVLGNLTLLVLLDYSKVFDTLNYKLISSTLKHVGLSHNALLLVMII
ncbi:hypothetical protein JTB14_022867 [Gonioctena quinquepunctata]|nr:hypothetical protein JTB14_022867 [Gonioctena quinquepunctata]